VGGKDYPGLAVGLLPSLNGADTPSLAAGIVGATVMPHVVYLHSALLTNRVMATDRYESRVLLSYNRWDCVGGLGIAGLINLAMLGVAAALFRRRGGADAGELQYVQAHLATLVGGGAALAFGIALIASGLSSCSVGTYAGQVVMTGFTDWRIPLSVRRVARMLPSVVVLAAGINTSQVLVFSQIILSFGIPFAFVPLLLITGSRCVMADIVNSRTTNVLMLVITVLITVLNAYLVCHLVGLF
jgi:manganese transport protein